MAILRRLASLLYVAMLVGSVTACVSEEVRIQCINSSPGTCVVPMYALYARSPKDYAGNYIITTGFLQKSGDIYLIIPDEWHAKFSVPELGIRLVDMNGIFAKVLKEHQNEYVQVIGKIKDANPPIFWAELVLDRPPQLVPIIGGEPKQPWWGEAR